MKTFMVRTLALALVFMMATVAVAFAEPNTELSGTLRILGPGLFTQMGPDGKVDLVSGQTLPGYNALIEEFNEDYPNVKVEVNAIPWDNWIAVMQTAAAGGTADVLLHGAMLAELSVDLTEYLEKDPEVYEALAIKPELYRPDADNYNVVAPTGLSYKVAPYFVLVDTKLFEDFGVELPTDDWTYDDMLEIAQKLTGVNPVTGEECYGAWAYGISGSYKFLSSICSAWGVKGMVFDSPNKYDAKMQFDTEEMTRVLSYINEFYKCAPPSFIEDVGVDKIGTAENNIALYITENPLEKYQVTVANGTEDRYIYMPLPITETTDESTYSGFTGTNSIAISKTASDPDLAWEFLKWMILDEDANDWVLATGNLPATFYGMSKLDETKPYTECIRKVLDNFWPNFTVTQCEGYDSAYGNAETILENAMTGLMSGMYTPETCGEYIQQQLVEYQMLNK